MDFTRHSLQRFTERFPNLLSKGVDPKTTMLNVFGASSIDKRFKNNSAYMVYLMSRYGDNDFTFRVNGDVLFICKNVTIITIVDRNDTSSEGYKNHGESRNRYKKRSVAA